MQTSSNPDLSIELGHPDYFAEQFHPNAVSDFLLADIFRPSVASEMQSASDVIGDIEKTEKKLKEAKETLSQLEQNYINNNCHKVLTDKAALETVGAIGSWVTIFMPLLPQEKVSVALAIVLGAVSKVATDTANEAGKKDAYQVCQECNNEIALQQNKVKAAHERYQAAVKELAGVYTQSVRRKQTSETQIRDWKNYAYKLQVHRHQLDPSKPKPSAPVYAFRATPVPAERVMRLGADMFQHIVKANGL
jgi:hypothetical protein